MMHRFFVPKDWIQSDKIIFQGAIARQMTRVLHIARSERVIALNNEGDEYLCEVIDAGSTVTAEIIKKQQVTGEPTCKVDLFFPLSHREKTEWILQKCTEIGAFRFRPFTCARSLVQDVVVPEAKMTRWNSILREAAEQSGRGLVPKLDNPEKLAALVPASTEYEVACLAWENEQKTTLSQLLSNSAYSSIAIMIGPEGGFVENEVDQLCVGGWRSFTLGRRILRLETAAVVACALVLNEKD